MVTDGLREAIATLGVDELPLVHSDQGLQYRHRLWQETLSQSGLTQSMSRKGTCLDNAVMEGFFSHLKEERFRLAQPATVADFYVGLNRYLAWWKSTRIQARLDYLSPDEYLAAAPTRRTLSFSIQLSGPSPLLRQYFPKGADLSAHSAADLAAVAAELNGRPRKTLGWATPAEAMNRLLSDPSQPVVATTL